MWGEPPGERPLGEGAVGDVTEGDVLPDGELVRAGKGEQGFDLVGELAEIAVVESDGVPAADDGRAGVGRETLLSGGAVGHADRATSSVWTISQEWAATPIRWRPSRVGGVAAPAVCIGQLPFRRAS